MPILTGIIATFLMPIIVPPHSLQLGTSVPKARDSRPKGKRQLSQRQETTVPKARETITFRKGLFGKGEKPFILLTNGFNISKTYVYQL